MKFRTTYPDKVCGSFNEWAAYIRQERASARLVDSARTIITMAWIQATKPKQ